MFGLKDAFGREVDELRISVTQRRNPSCFYCHREGEEGKGGELSVAANGRISKAARRISIKKARLAGGEPLLRARPGRFSPAPAFPFAGGRGGEAEAQFLIL